MDVFADATNLMKELRAGAEVFDLTGAKIGTVKHVQAPSDTLNPSLADFLYNLESSKIATELAYRLMRSGFVHIKTRWLERDRIATPDQIATVLDGSLGLNTKKENLLAL